MPTSPTAILLNAMVVASGCRPDEIARRAGLSGPNVLTMMRQGLTRVPLGRIDALARACGADPAPLRASALREYGPRGTAVPPGRMPEGTR